jgi:hypothetical protein
LFFGESIKDVYRYSFGRGAQSLGEKMDKKLKIIIMIIFSLLMLSTIYFAVFEASLNDRLVQKDSEVNRLNNQVIELQKQLDNQLKATLVTSLGISIEPRNNTEYPHPHFTIEGVVFNVGSKTAYNARLDITAYYKNGVSAFNMSIPLGNMEKWQIVQVSKIIVTSDWIGNYTVIPMSS